MHRRAVLALAAAVVVSAGAGAAFFGASASAENVTHEALSGAVLASDAGLFVVDIRRPEEWKQTGVIKGARLVTDEGPEAFLKAVQGQMKPGQKLALICRSGNRTGRAAGQLAGLLDAPIVDVTGGMLRVLGEGYRPVPPSRDMGCQAC